MRRKYKSPGRVSRTLAGGKLPNEGEATHRVLATGETQSVREFLELAFRQVDRKIEWRGKGVDEVSLQPDR
jgi:GDP-D-mannose dehydratase